MSPDRFAPYGDLAAVLLPHAVWADDASHDLAHIHRVWRHARAIQAEDGGDLRVVAAAVIMHDSVALEKNSPLRHTSSRLAAEKASGVLRDLGWDEAGIAAVAHAIEAHSFSARVEPLTLEARIVQDADRLDSLGAMGVARCFHVAGRLGRLLYDPADPRADRRPLDEQAFTIDHFQTKLLSLASGFRTEGGRRRAAEGHARLERFFAEFLEEAGV